MAPLLILLLLDIIPPHLQGFPTNFPWLWVPLLLELLSNRFQQDTSSSWPFPSCIFYGIRLNSYAQGEPSAPGPTFSPPSSRVQRSLIPHTPAPLQPCAAWQSACLTPIYLEKNMHLGRHLRDYLESLCRWQDRLERREPGLHRTGERRGKPMPSDAQCSDAARYRFVRTRACPVWCFHRMPRCPWMLADTWILTSPRSGSASPLFDLPAS